MATSWTPTSALGLAVYAAGFTYDPEQDIILSRPDALQRKFGYAYGYDASALGMSMVGGLGEVLYQEIVAGKAEQLPALLPELMYALVLPFEGREAAERELSRAPRRAAASA